MKTMLSAAVLALGVCCANGAYAAAPLNDKQMDAVTAGSDFASAFASGVFTATSTFSTSFPGGSVSASSSWSSSP